MVLQTVRLPKDGALQSQLMMCERRAEQIRTVIPQRELMFDVCVCMCTHTRTQAHARVHTHRD